MFRPPRLWSLADMIEHFALKFGNAYAQLLGAIHAIHQRDQQDHIKPIQERVLSQGYRHFMFETGLKAIIEEIERLQMNELLVKGHRLHAQLLDDINTWTADRLLDALKE